MQYGIINWIKLVAEKRLTPAELPETSIVFCPLGLEREVFMRINLLSAGSRSRGFTLAHLLCVIALVGVLSGLAIPLVFPAPP
jgi:hypothetical protein